MKKKIIFGSVILLAITGMVLGFTILKAEKKNGVGYITEPLIKGDIESLVVTTGILNPVLLVDIGTQVSGNIEEIYVDFNSRVKKGQVLAKIDQSSFLTNLRQNEANFLSAQAGLDKAKTTLDNLEKKFGRYSDLFAKSLVSFEEMETIETQYFNAKADLQSAKAKLAQAQSQLDSSRVDLNYTIIKSPVDGVVIDRKVNVGQTVAASMQTPVLFCIAQDLSQMQVECSVDEADIGIIREGQRVKFTVDAYPEEEFTGKVSQIRYSPDITQNVVTYTTIVAVENPELKLLPGMTATVSIVSGEAIDALLVPNSALRFTPQFNEKDLESFIADRRKSGVAGSNPGQNDSARIWILDETNTPKPVSVKTGVTDNSYTEIVEGDLTEGQPILTGESSSETKAQKTSSSNSMGQMMRMLR